MSSNQKTNNTVIPVLYCHSRGGRIFVCEARAVDRSKLALLPNIERVVDGSMTVAAFNKIAETNEATRFFAGQTLLERAAGSAIAL